MGTRIPDIRLTTSVRFSEKSVLLVARLHIDLCRLASVTCRA
ncbi:putative leader peptide [Actinomadura xylanilytica]